MFTLVPCSGLDETSARDQLPRTEGSEWGGEGPVCIYDEMTLAVATQNFWFGSDRDQNQKSGLSACMDRFLTGRSGGNQFYTKKVILITR